MPRRINCKPTTQQDEREGGVPWEGTETAGRREMYKEESEVKERGKGRIYKMEEKERKKKKKRIANHYLESIRRGPALTEWDREEEEEVGQVTRRHAGIVLLTHGKYATTFLAKDLLVVD